MGTDNSGTGAGSSADNEMLSESMNGDQGQGQGSCSPSETPAAATDAGDMVPLLSTAGDLGNQAASSLTLPAADTDAGAATTTVMAGELGNQAPSSLTLPAASTDSATVTKTATADDLRNQASPLTLAAGDTEAASGKTTAMPGDLGNQAPSPLTLPAAADTEAAAATTTATATATATPPATTAADSPSITMGPPSPDSADPADPLSVSHDAPDSAPAVEGRKARRAKSKARDSAEGSKKSSDPSRKRTRPAHAKPHLPLSPMEQYHQTCSSLSFVEMVEAWRALTDEEREEFTTKADEARQHFENEYESWRLDRLDRLGKLEKTVEFLLEAKETDFQRKLLRAEKELKQRTAKLGQVMKQAMPSQAKSAYAFFCKDFAAKRKSASSSDAANASTSASTEKPDVAEEGLEALPEGAKIPKGSRTLREMREAWSQLDHEERERFGKMAAEDEVRFRAELEEFRSKFPDANLPAGLPAKRRRLVKVPEQVFLRPQTEMSNLLQLAHDRGLQERREALKRNRLEGESESNLPALPTSDDPSRSGWEGAEGAGARAGAARASVDDLLGGLLDDGEGSAAGDGWNQGGGSASSWFGGGGASSQHEGAIVPHGSWGQDSFAGSLPGKSRSSASGDPAVLGPRLRIDESGNIIVDETSLSFGPETSFSEEGPVTTEESVTQYKEAYQRTSRSKWTDKETDDFYEALRIYGTDLFLVQTFFRNKSAAQIKQKYSREVKRNPAKVNLALTVEARKLTRSAFESLHGKIDTERHFKPPPSPVPGEEEPDGSLAGSFFGQPMPEMPPPPEPEFSVEDESHTTNRLMALFE